MTTLRRELIKTIETILNDYMKSGYSYLGEEIPLELCEKIADAVIDLKKPKIDLSKTDPAWSILAGEKVETTDSILANNAKNAFEKDMAFGSLPWSSNRQWEKFETFVVQEYEKDNLIFAKYKTWQQSEGKYVALSNKKIRENPEHFIACFPDFLAHSQMYGKKDTRAPQDVKLDDHGAPITY